MKLDLTNASNNKPITVDTTQISAVEDLGDKGCTIHLVGGNTINVQQSHESVTDAWIGEDGEVKAIDAPGEAAPPPPPPAPKIVSRGARGRAK